MTTSAKFDCIYEKDEFDSSEPGILIFSFNVAGINMEFTLYEPGLVGMQRWSDFLSSYQKGKKYSLVFCNSNGDVSIVTNLENTIFNVFKSGAGGDGSSTLVIPNTLVEKTMRKAFNLLCADKTLWK